MRLNELGEFGLIKRFSPLFSQNLPPEIKGIGDDCAVISQNAQQAFLMTTDLLVESVHFIKENISPEDLGYKSLAVSLSDIAAMGGTPLYAFLSIGLPADQEVDWVDRFFQGFQTLAQAEHVLLLGGDTTRSPTGIIINCLVVGTAHKASIKLRSTAQIGDLVCSTGYLGDSGAGLKILLDHLPLNAVTQPLVQEHNRPRPHLPEGQWLAQQLGVHAMMDISDGLDSDICRILESSYCGAEINLASLPLSPSFRICAQQFSWQGPEMAATAGEDYCLLVTVDPKRYESINTAYQQLFERPLFKLGQITASSSFTPLYRLNGQPYSLSKRGFDHFAET